MQEFTLFRSTLENPDWNESRANAELTQDEFRKCFLPFASASWDDKDLQFSNPVPHYVLEYFRTELAARNTQSTLHYEGYYWKLR